MSTKTMCSVLNGVLALTIIVMGLVQFGLFMANGGVLFV